MAVAFTPLMNKTITMLTLALFGSTSAMAAECLLLPEETPVEAPTPAPVVYEATWEETLDELTASDRLVVVAASVGDEIVLDPGFKVANVEVEDLWITDVEIARRGKGVVVHPTQVGVTHLFVADENGWVLEYELEVEAGVESAELKAYEVNEAPETEMVAELD